MRVLVLSSVFPNKLKPFFGVFVKERVRHVARDCDVVVVAPIAWFPFNGWLRGYQGSEIPPVDDCEGLRVYHPRYFCVPAFGKCLDAVFYFASLISFLMRLRKTFPFELIDAHFSYPDGVGASLLGKLFRCPVIVTLRGTHDIRHSRFHLRRAQIKLALRSAAAVICVSDSLRQFGLNLGISADRLHVIPNGIDRKLFIPAARAVSRENLGLPLNATILLAVGALIEGKGHHRIIELLPEILVGNPELLFVALGDDSIDRSYRFLLEGLIKEQGLQNHVKLVPAQPHAQIPLWMNSADLFCLATRSEGRCNAILEALSCGLPVVTTDVGGNRELVHNGENGFLEAFWNKDAFAAAISRALAMDWDRAAISNGAGVNTWKGTARRVVKEFHSALERRNGERMFVNN